jgi:hypothetical protein
MRAPALLHLALGQLAWTAGESALSSASNQIEKDAPAYGSL